jgi:glucose/arabinose dehydrogenase
MGFAALVHRLMSLLVILIAAVGYRLPMVVSDGPPCKPTVPWVFRPAEICGEVIVQDLDSQGIASISALTFGPDGSLYFARPATSQIMRLAPDGQGFFRDPQVFASSLPEPPNGLAFDPVDNTWYASGDTLVVRLRDRDNDGAADDMKVIVQGLPGGAGGWLGNIRVGPDRRLYVAKASSCDACIETDPRRAALLSFALDGSDMQIVARGLRDSYDFDWQPTSHVLYIVDNERAGMPAKLNAVTHSGLDFGWPRCDPAGQPVQGIPGADAQYCAQTARPVAEFDPGSHPMGAVFYSGANFPEYQGKLLVALAGSWNATTTAGYELVAVTLSPDGRTGQVQRILPVTPRSTSDAALIRTSFYPYHLTGVAISPEGWIYLSLAEGRIYRFRRWPG